MPRHELTRFPHAVLEVKLSLPEGQKPPEWVQSLLTSRLMQRLAKNMSSDEHDGIGPSGI